MKVYNVNIYEIDHKVAPGNLWHKGHGLVKVNMFGAREIVTNTKLRICDKNDPDGNVFFSIYEKQGYLLGIEKSEIIDRHLASLDEVNEYINNWEDSELKKYFEEIKILSKEEFKKINEKVRKLSKM